MTIVRTLVFLVAAACLGWSGSAAADCAQERAADQIFAHPYGEPPAPCPVGEASSTLEKEHVDVLADERGPRQLQSLGISGLGAGTTIAGIGGLLLLVSLFLDEDDRSHPVFHWGGIGAASVGGAVFLAGGALLIADFATAPAPTPDRKGAQLILAFRF
ncbi:MAG: hypothetical protein HY901_12380 [Deltaproteobacteria bacterium]|nr:hypothetical protein [Deltaproteobacteria bacterium]